MKKNFFKKLSFVMALAMTVSLTSPAAGAFAAAKPKLNATKKYLKLDVEKANEYDFNIKNKKSGWKYLWTSSNKKVVSVNKKNGVTTAEGVGTAKVTVVITDKAGEEVAELKATVVVRDNIKELDITNVPAENRLAVNVENDFNRSFKTVSGSTKKTSAITRWSVDKEGATINDSGVFKATVAGEYTVTARAFQSKEKYNLWLSDSEKYASYVLATDTEKVTVAPSIVSFTQVNLKKFNVAFDSAVTDVADKLTIYQMVAGTKVKELAKEITVDADNKVATIEMNSIVGGATYVVEYPGMKEATLVAAKAEAKNVQTVKVKTTQAQVYEPTKVEIELLDANGVDIADDDLLGRVELESSSDDAILVDKVLTMYQLGKTTQITATFHTQNYDTNGDEIGNLKGTGTIVCVEDVADKVSAVKAYTIDDAGKASPDYDKAKHSISTDTTGKALYVKFRMDAADVDDYDFDNSTDDSHRSYFEFKSSNETVLMIDENTGALYPIKEGSSVVVIKYDGKEVGTVAITVTANRKLAIATFDNNSFSLSNIGDSKKVGVTVKDQYGDEYNDYAIAAVTVDTWTVTPNVADDEIVFTTSAGMTAKKYNFKFEVKDTNDSKIVKNLAVTVDVKAPDTKVAYIGIVTDKASYDVKLEDTDATSYSYPTVNVAVFAYDKNGVKMRDLTSTVMGNLRFTQTQTGTGNLAVNTVSSSVALAAKDQNVTVASGQSGTVTFTGSAILKAKTGAYTIAYVDAANNNKFGWDVNGDGTIAASEKFDVRSAYFKVADTQKAPVVKLDKKFSELSDAFAAIQECLKVEYNGEEYAIVSAKYTKTASAINVSKVTIAVPVKANGVTEDNLYLTVDTAQYFKYNQ